MEDIFDIEPIESNEAFIEKEATSELSIEDVEKDYEHARAELYSLISKGQEAVNGILDVAQNTDHPRAYEVAFQGIKNVADITEKLADLQRKMKDIKTESKKSSPTTVNNTMFVGSTADLAKMLKNASKNLNSQKGN